MTRKLPKSLHTVTVLVNLSETLIDMGEATGTIDALSQAVDILGLGALSDDYDLVGKAERQLAAKRKA